MCHLRFGHLVKGGGAGALRRTFTEYEQPEILFGREWHSGGVVDCPVERANDSLKFRTKAITISAVEQVVVVGGEGLCISGVMRTVSLKVVINAVVVPVIGGGDECRCRC